MQRPAGLGTLLPFQEQAGSSGEGGVNSRSGLSGLITKNLQN